jgi:hypothetical protein
VDHTHVYIRAYIYGHTYIYVHRQSDSSMGVACGPVRNTNEVHKIWDENLVRQLTGLGFDNDSVVKVCMYMHVWKCMHVRMLVYV